MDENNTITDEKSVNFDLLAKAIDEHFFDYNYVSFTNQII
jgi:hypothetical protein